MKKRKVILLYSAVLMILSQTQWEKSVVFLAIPLLIILVFRHPKINSFGFKKILFLNLIVLLGLVSGILHLTENDLYYFARDILYFIQAPIFIIIGMYLYKEIKDFKRLLKALLLTSFVITVYKLTGVFADISIILQLGLEIRKEYDVMNYTALLAFTILFYTRKNKYKIFNNYIELLIISISLFSIVISFSRTMYLILPIIVIIPYVSRIKVIYKMYGFLIVLILFVNFGGLLMEVETSGTQGDTFESKIMYSLNEIIVKDYNTRIEINNNWRGYEAYLGLSKYYTGTLGELLFGQGYGTVVMTPSWIFGGEKLNVLPMFHNGYITIILKTGLIGLVFFFMFLSVLLKMGYRNIIVAVNKQDKLVSTLLIASVFIILVRTFVIHGIFTTTVPVLLLILIGWIIQMSVYQDRFRIRNFDRKNNLK